LCGEYSDADTLLKLVQKFQDWSGLKISTKKSIATGALYGREARRGKTMANAKARREKARNAKSRGLSAACEGDDAFIWMSRTSRWRGLSTQSRGKP